MALTVAAAFTQSNGDSPATGLTLADIDLYLTSQNKTTGATAVIWDGTQNPTAEVDNAGIYTRIYSSEDFETYNYFARAQYTGASTLDQDTVQGAVSAPNNDILPEITGIADAPVTPNLRQAMMLLYMWLRNNSQSTATERRVLNDAGAEIADALMSDDGTTFQQGKLSAP